MTLLYDDSYLLSKDLAEGVNPTHAKQLHNKAFVVVSRATENLALIARGQNGPHKIMIFECGTMFDIRKCFLDLSKRRHYPHLLLGAPETLIEKYKNIEPELWSNLDHVHSDKLDQSKKTVKQKKTFTPKIGRQTIVGQQDDSKISLPPLPKITRPKLPKLTDNIETTFDDTIDDLWT